MGSCHSDPQNGHKQAEYQEQKQINPGQRLPYSYKFQHSNNQSINSHSSQQLIPVGSLNGDQGKQFIEGMENNQEEIPNNDQIDPETSRITLPQNLLNESLRGLPQQADDPVGYHQPSSKLGKITNQQLEITKKMKQLLSKIGNFSLPQMDQAFTILPEIGVVQYENEIKYFGQYFKGKRQGLGKQTWGDGSFYQGEIFNKIKSSLNSIKGYFLDDKIHGYGRLIYYNGDYYIGNWKNNESDGIGKYVDTFGNEYEGEWQENQQNGKGVEQQSDGTFYEGEFRDGQKHGQGQLVTDEYDYVGEFRHNKMDGKGEIRWKDGRTYKGDFKENLLHGQGEFQWPHGASYIGSYAKSNQQGYGKMLFSDGQIYEGQWKNGLQDGKGFFTDKDGDQQKGFWKQGRLTQD